MNKERNNGDFMQYILVTGAYGGMGQSTSKLLAEQGYTVIALDKNVDDAQHGIIPLQVDITDEESVKFALYKVKQITDKLYAIIHFAGIYLLDSLVEMDKVEFVKAFEVNLFGAFIINKTFLPLLDKGSRIIITTSELAPLDPLPFTGIYAVTKAALDKYAYSLRMELQLLNIFVSVLRAGAVNTNMLGVSTTALDRFCDKTKLYEYNADCFKKIVDRVEAKKISPTKVAKKISGILRAYKPKFAYSINRNPLLLLLNVFPKRFQLWIIRVILKKSKKH